LILRRIWSCRLFQQAYAFALNCREPVTADLRRGLRCLCHRRFAGEQRQQCRDRDER
jgi:hypothetical protein